MFAITNSNGNSVTIDYATNAYGNKVFVIDGFIEVVEVREKNSDWSKTFVR